MICCQVNTGLDQCDQELEGAECNVLRISNSIYRDNPATFKRFEENVFRTKSLAFSRRLKIK